MRTGVNVLSLFNGNGGTWLALDELQVPIDNMYVSEVDKYAIQAADLLNPDNINLGDVTKWREWDIDWCGIDMIVAGFPCQAWSLAGKQKGDDDPRGALVHDLLDIHRFIRALNPRVKFMFENVAMKKEFMNFINNLFQTEPVLINSALVTAQNRKRNYWANWEITQPEDRGILLKDIIEGGTVDREKSRCVLSSCGRTTEREFLTIWQGDMVVDHKTIMSDTFTERQKGRKCLVNEPKDKASNLSAMEYVKNGRQGDYIACDNDGNQTVFVGRVVGRRINPVTGKRDDYNPDVKIVQRLEARPDEKSGTITTVQKDNVLITEHPKYRKLTPRECFRLQGWPEHHIDTLLNSGISNTQLYKMCGNGFNHPTIVHNIQCLLDTGWLQDCDIVHRQT